MWGAYFVWVHINIMKCDVVLVIKIHRVLILCGHILSKFYGTAQECILYQFWLNWHKMHFLYVQCTSFNYLSEEAAE